jgi:GNAT superfamily N-acetyltransferase
MASIDSARMGLPDSLSAREAVLDDVPAIAALRESAGWTVHEWALHAVIGQPHARCVVVTDPAGGLAGLGSGIAYGRLGFVGNMVVADAFRRRGVGTAILDDVAGWLARAGCTRLELNATEDGKHLYARHGFASRGRSATARVPRSTPLTGDPSVRIRPAAPIDLDTVSGYDEPRFGGDRRPVLGMLLSDPGCRAAIAELDGEPAGYSVVRVDEPRLGPLVADSPRIAAALVGWAFEAVPTTDQMRLSLPPENRVGATWLRELAIPIEEWDGRMARGPDVPRRDETIYQMAVGPLG